MEFIVFVAVLFTAPFVILISVYLMQFDSTYEIGNIILAAYGMLAICILAFMFA